MPTPPTYTDAFNIVGTDSGTYKTWAKLRTTIYGGDYPGYETAGDNVHYLTGFYPTNGTFIKSPYTPSITFTQPTLRTTTSGADFILIASAYDFDTAAHDAIIGQLAVFDSGEDDTVSEDAFTGGQVLGVTTDPNFVYSLSGWTRIT